jgi:hypothetical protein
MTAVNGFDGISHYLRAGLITNLCQSYSIEHVTGCNANFTQTKIVPAGSNAKRDATLVKLQQSLARYLRVFDTSTGKPVAGQEASAKTPEEARQQLFHPTGQNASPQVETQRNQGVDNIKEHGENGTSQNQPQPSQESPEAQLLDYLLGSDSK